MKIKFVLRDLKIVDYYFVNDYIKAFRGEVNARWLINNNRIIYKFKTLVYGCPRKNSTFNKTLRPCWRKAKCKKGVT